MMRAPSEGAQTGQRSSNRTLLPRGQTLEAVEAAFAWHLPDRFNIANACCGHWAAVEPERTALLSWEDGQEPRATTYGELNAMSNRLANALLEAGLEAGDRVAIILPQSVEAAATHMAVYKAGLIAVPLARLFAADALEMRMRRADVAAAITNGDGWGKLKGFAGSLPSMKAIMVRGGGDGAIDFDAALAAGSPEFETVENGPDTPSLIIFTSGTTGPPKGALHGHRVLLGHLPGVELHHEFLPQAGDIAWTPADWAWAGGLLNVLLPCLYHGVPVVFGGLERFEPEGAFRLLEQMNVTNAFIPPTALRLMKTVEKPAARYSLSLRTIGSGGESLGKDTFDWAKKELGLSINEFYGQTECNLVLSSCAKLGVSRPGAIGKPVPGHEVAAVRPDGTICEVGERGEVAIKRPDPVMFLEYWQDPEATAKKFVGDWMLTGDQCVVDEEGYFHFVGRDDDIINSAGYRVGPSEIEDCLVSHPAVRLAAAVGKPDALRTEIVKAYVVLNDGYLPGEPIAEEIRAHVKARMAANIYPREIGFVDDIPLTTTGKVIRRHFRDLARKEAELEAATRS